MSIVERPDRVRELQNVPTPSESANPILLADEDTLVIAYRCGPPSTRNTADATLVVFHQCYANHFGPPNDHAFATHRLAEGGLSPHGAFVVENSTWIRGLASRNLGHPRHDPQVFQQLQHWVWTFQHTVLECAAVSYVVERAEVGPADLVPRMLEKLQSQRGVPKPGMAALRLSLTDSEF